MLIMVVWRDRSSKGGRPPENYSIFPRENVNSGTSAAKGDDYSDNDVRCAQVAYKLL